MPCARLWDMTTSTNTAADQATEHGTDRTDTDAECGNYTDVEFLGLFGHF